MTNQATFALIEECRAALAEELSAWDIDPPLHHVKQAHDKCVAWLAATQPAPQPEAQALPPEWTPEMSRAVQLYSELGAYAAANLSGAYDLFDEFWRIAIQASRPAEAQAKSEPAASDARDAARYRWLRDNTDSDWAICEWNTDEWDGIGYYRDARAPNIVDAEIDAAIAATQGGGTKA